MAVMKHHHFLRRGTSQRSWPKIILFIRRNIVAALKGWVYAASMPQLHGFKSLTINGYTGRQLSPLALPWPPLCAQLVLHVLSMLKYAYFNMYKQYG